MSQNQSAEVRSKGKIIATAEYPKYDSVQEALDGMGEDATLSLVNAMVKTNAMNSARSANSTKKNKTVLTHKAIAWLGENNGFSAENQELHGGVQGCIDAKVKELQEETEEESEELEEEVYA